jgi:hypothetical protein
MNIGTIISTISSIIMILVTIFSVYTSVRKLPTELRTGDVDIAEKAMKLVNDEIQRRITMTAEIDTLKLKISDNETSFSKKLEACEADLKTCNDECTKFKDWSKRLCAQLVSQGYIPVSLERTPNDLA